MSISLLLVVLTGAAAFASPPASSTAKLQNVNFGAFTQTATYSIANQLGFFTAYGINVTYLQVPNSTYGYDQLLNGGYDIMTGTIDNAVNLRFNQNKSLAVPGQLDGGPELTIASIPSIKRIPELKGKSLMVDSPVSGYAYILRKVLSLYGLRLENGDYDFQVSLKASYTKDLQLMFHQIVGSTVLRYADLVNGSLPNGTAVYATIFTYPFTSEAKGITGDKHPNILASISDFIQPFSSSAFTVREDALANQTERALMRKFIAAMYTANKYLADPSHKECAVNSISK